MANIKKVILKKQIEGVLYDLLVKTDAKSVSYDDSTVYDKLAEALASIATLNGESAGSITEKIQKAIEGKADKADVISEIVASTTNGALTITKGNASSEVKIAGVVTVPEYEEETRKLTLPYVTSDGTSQSVVMNLGKDMVVKSGRYEEESQEIVLVLTDDSEVKIPAKALVDVYTGETSNSIQVTVSEDNKISAEVRISTKENNIVQVIEEEGKEGLYVPQQTVSVTADDVTETETRKFMTQEEKTKLESLKNYDDTEIKKSIAEKGKIIVSAQQPEGLTDNDLWMQEITD